MDFGEPALNASKRKRSKNKPLSDQQVVTVALELIRRHGADRLSMRQIAKELGVTPMTIYYYVGNKDALFERCADAVLARVPRPSPSGRDWHNEVKACAVHGFRFLSEYPGLCGQIIKRPPTRQTLELASYGITILVAAGFDPEAAARATVICQTFVFGMIGMQAQLEQAQRPVRKSRGHAGRHDAPMLGAGQLEQVDVQGLVEFGLETMLIGLREKLTRQTGGKNRTKATVRVRGA